MSEQETYFRALLACHGGDVNRWPLDMRHIGYEALKHPHLARLIEEEKYFEKLLSLGKTPAPSPDLAHRIIAAAYSNKHSASVLEQFFDLLLVGKPAALAAVLVLGFAFGLGITAISPANHTQLLTQYSTEDEGAIL